MQLNKDSNSALCKPPSIATTQHGQHQLNELANLQRKIACRTSGRVDSLRVEAYGDAVVLSGRTNTYYIKQLATQVALDDNANLNLTNSIEVV